MVQVPPQCGTVSQSGFGGKILRRHAGNKAHHRQQDQQPALAPDLAHVPVLDAGVHDGGHHQRHQKLKAGFQHLEQGSQYGFPFVAFQIMQQSTHASPTFIKMQEILYHVPPYLSAFLPGFDDYLQLRRLYLL